MLCVVVQGLLNRFHGPAWRGAKKASERAEDDHHGDGGDGGDDGDVGDDDGDDDGDDLFGCVDRVSHSSASSFETCSTTCSLVTHHLLKNSLKLNAPLELSAP